MEREMGESKEVVQSMSISEALNLRRGWTFRGG